MKNITNNSRIENWLIQLISDENSKSPKWVNTTDILNETEQNGLCVLFLPSFTYMKITTHSKTLKVHIERILVLADERFFFFPV